MQEILEQAINQEVMAESRLAFIKSDTLPSNPLTKMHHSPTPWEPDFERMGVFFSPNRKLPFTPKQIHAVCSHLRHKPRDLCLFALGLDSMLRSGDLLHIEKLSVLKQDGEIADRVGFYQGKTRNLVVVEFSPFTQGAIAAWLDQMPEESPWLFPSLQNPQKPLSACRFRRIVKQWAALAGLDPKRYSGHSLRRSKPTEIYDKTGCVESCRVALGQQSTSATSSYLGVDLSLALKRAASVNLLPEVKS